MMKRRITAAILIAAVFVFLRQEYASGYYSMNNSFSTKDLNSILKTMVFISKYPVITMVMGHELYVETINRNLFRVRFSDDGKYVRYLSINLLKNTLCFAVMEAAAEQMILFCTGSDQFGMTLESMAVFIVMCAVSVFMYGIFTAFMNAQTALFAAVLTEMTVHVSGLTAYMLNSRIWTVVNPYTHLCSLNEYHVCSPLHWLLYAAILLLAVLAFGICLRRKEE